MKEVRAVSLFVWRQTEIFQRDRYSVGPQRLEVVVFASVFVKEMDHEAAVIENDPTALLIPLDPHAMVAEAFFEGVVDLLADRMQLTAAGSRSDDEEIEFSGLAADVKNEDVAAVVFDRNASSLSREFSRVVEPVGPNRAALGFHRIATR